MDEKVVSKVASVPVKAVTPAKPATAVSELQRGSTTERAAIKAKITAELAKIEKDHLAGSVLPDVRVVLASLLEWISGREARTNARPGGL